MFVCACVHVLGSINLQLEHNSSIWKQIGRVRHWTLPHQGQDNGMTSNDKHCRNGFYFPCTLGAVSHLWNVLGC